MVKLSLSSWKSYDGRHRPLCPKGEPKTTVLLTTPFSPDIPYSHPQVRRTVQRRPTLHLLHGVIVKCMSKVTDIPTCRGSGSYLKGPSEEIVVQSLLFFGGTMVVHYHLQDQGGTGEQGGIPLGNDKPSLLLEVSRKRL